MCTRLHILTIHIDVLNMVYYNENNCCQRKYLIRIGSLLYFIKISATLTQNNVPLKNQKLNCVNTCCDDRTQCSVQVIGKSDFHENFKLKAKIMIIIYYRQSWP